MSAPTPRPIDTAMINVVKSMSEIIIDITNKSVQEILSISSKFMSDTSQKALQDFHRLYFSSDTLSIKKDDVNADVDLLFEAIQKSLEAGEDPNSIEEVEEDKTVRLGLAALQKQLESIVQLDRGMREKLVPAIMSMQFEDATRQRLTHLAELWKLVAENAHEPPALLQKSVDEKMKKVITTALEKELYYLIVLKEEPPAMVDDNETWLNSLL
jgi:hypothetical protein